MGGNCGNVALQKLMDIYVPVLFYFLGCIFAQARHMVHEEWIDHQLQAVQDQKCQDCNLALCAGWAIASMSRSAPDVCSAVQGDRRSMVVMWEELQKNDGKFECWGTFWPGM
jgi:hypothetical protein